MTKKQKWIIGFVVMGLSGILFAGGNHFLKEARAADWRAYMSYAKQLNDQAKYPEAFKYAEAAIKMNPNSWESHYEAARSLSNMGRRHTAIWHFQLSVKNAPDTNKTSLESMLVQFRGTENTPEWPAKTLHIFEDDLTHGANILFTTVDGRANKKSRYSKVSDPAKFGTHSIYFRMHPEVDTQAIISFVGAWKTENLPYPGDLTPYREQGALIFWIKAKNPGSSYSVGFRMIAKEEDGRGKTPGSTLSLGKYCFLNTEWQKVVIPLSDFFVEGYYWQREVTEDGDSTERWVRYETFFDWKKVEGFHIESPKTDHGEQAFWIDEMVVVMEYDKTEATTLKNLARSRERENRGTEDFVIFDDIPRQIFWWYPLNYAYVILDENEQYKGKKSARVTLEPKNYSGAGTNFQELDLTEMRAWGALEYWVKGDSGGEHWGHSLRARFKGGEFSVYGPDIRYYTDISRTWEKVSIPLADFPAQGGRWDSDQSRWILGKFDWTRVFSISWYINPVDEGEMVFYLDEIRLVPKQTIDMERKKKSVPTMVHRIPKKLT